MTGKRSSSSAIGPHINIDESLSCLTPNSNTFLHKAHSTPTKNDEIRSTQEMMVVCHRAKICIGLVEELSCIIMGSSEQRGHLEEEKMKRRKSLIIDHPRIVRDGVKKKSTFFKS